jgi:hypothetical protein
MLLSGQGFAQRDSLTLVVSSAYKSEDSADSYLIRIDFTSWQQRPITLYKKPLRPFICCWDFEEEIGVEIQKLDSTCYTAINKCADCHNFFPPKYVKEDMVKLNYGETISYSGDISLFDRYGRNGKQVGFYGNYRCRAYWIYYVDGKREKTISKWMYINFQGYK